MKPRLIKATNSVDNAVSAAGRGATMTVDADRRLEIRISLKQLVVLLVVFNAFLLALKQQGMTWPLFSFYASCTTFLLAYRAWAVDRFLPSNVEIHARVFVSRCLPQLLGALDRDHELRERWESASPAIVELRSATDEELTDIMKMLQIAGYPHHRPNGVMSLLGSVTSFSLGAVLGALLPGTSLNEPFKVLSNTDGVVEAFTSGSFYLSLSSTCVIIAVFIIFKFVVWYMNRCTTEQIGKSLLEDAATPLRDMVVSPHRFERRRLALVTDLRRAAALKGCRLEKLSDILDVFGAGPLPGRGFGFRISNWRLSTVNELSKNQFFLVLGLLLGLVLPNLFNSSS
jgi:hypothetical protein